MFDMLFLLMLVFMLFISIVIWDFMITTISNEWHDFTPIFPRRVDGIWTRKLQRRRTCIGSCAETCIDWIEYRIREE